VREAVNNPQVQSYWTLIVGMVWFERESRGCCRLRLTQILKRSDPTSAMRYRILRNCRVAVNLSRRLSITPQPGDSASESVVHMVSKNKIAVILDTRNNRLCQGGHADLYTAEIHIFDRIRLANITLPLSQHAKESDENSITNILQTSKKSPTHSQPTLVDTFKSTLFRAAIHHSNSGNKMYDV